MHLSFNHLEMRGLRTHHKIYTIQIVFKFNLNNKVVYSMLGLSTVGQVTFIQLINQCAKRKKTLSVILWWLPIREIVDSIRAEPGRTQIKLCIVVSRFDN